MNNKSFRNVLATTTLASVLIIPVGSVTLAAGNEAVESQLTQTQMSETPDVVTPNEIVGEYVQHLPSYGSADLGTFNSLDALFASVVEQNKTFASSVSFTYTGNLTNIKKDVNAALNKAFVQPGNDYVHGTLKSWSYSYTSAGQFTMEFTYHGTLEQEEFVTKRVQEIAAQLSKPGMSDFDKVRAVNEYVVTNTVYSKTAKTTPHHVYAYLAEGKAVCQAYALLTYRLLTEMGIESRYVVGFAGEAHAWNSVEIDGVWYHLDTTWNDGSFNGFDTLSNVGYKYFLVTSDTLRQNHTWDEADYPVATDNRYSYFHDIGMGIEHNNELYYMSAVDSTLNKLNLSTTKITQLLNRRVAYLAAHNEYVYYSDYSNGAYLTAYNMITQTTEVLDKSNVSQLQIVDGYLQYKVASKIKSYKLPLSELEQEVSNVEMKILALSEFSLESALTEARQAYTALTEDQKATVKNLARLTQLESVYPINKAAADAVATEVAKYTTSSTRTSLIQVIDQYEALTASQQALVSNKDLVATFKSVIAAQNAEIQAVEKAIAGLKDTSKTYLADVEQVREAYNALKSELQPVVSNLAALTKVENELVTVKAVSELIGALNGTSVTTIMEAREAYDDIPKTFQKHVTNLKILTDFEKGVKNVTAAIAAIDAINPAGTKFVAQVTAARKAYDKAGTQQSLVTNAAKFVAMETQVKVYSAIEALKPTSVKYIEEVLAVKAAYAALVNKEYVTNADKLTAAIKVIAPAQDVITVIEALDGSSIEAVVTARAAFTALDKTAQKFVTNVKDLAAIEKELAAVIKVINLITDVQKIDVKLSTFNSKVLSMEKAYKALPADKQLLVINVKDYNVSVALYQIKNGQKTRNWTGISVETFETLQISGVTTDNMLKVITGFNSLKAGTGTSTVEEIQSNVTKIISE